MVSLLGAFSKIEKQKIMVVGDFMLDKYTIGKAHRISPEAPVAVLQVTEEKHRAGGAGNVVLNLLSIGAEVVAVGRIGNDDNGKVLEHILKQEGVDTAGFLVDNNVSTPVKNRVIADQQQIVRVDYENIFPFDKQVDFEKLLDGVKLIAVSDYGKGFVTPEMMKALTECSRKKSIPILVDPKGSDYRKYFGVHLLKPNLVEAYAAAKLPKSAPLDEVASVIFSTTQANMLMITRAEKGISLFFCDGQRQDFPVPIREVRDVTGAGDTVLAVVAYALANRLAIEEAVHFSNLAAGLAVEKFGCASVNLSDLARRMADQNVMNKVFDEEHLFALQKILQERAFTLLEISCKESFTESLFHAIQLLGQRKEDLLVYVKGSDPKEKFIHLLASLHEVDYLVVNSSRLHECLGENVKLYEGYTLREGALYRNRREGYVDEPALSMGVSS